MSIRRDAGRLGTAHVSGNQIPKQSRKLDSEVLQNHQNLEEFRTNSENQDQNRMARDDMKNVITLRLTRNPHPPITIFFIRQENAFAALTLAKETKLTGNF